VDGGWILTKDIGVVLGLFWITAAYIIGHIIANLSGYLLEAKLVRGLLHPPEETLLEEKEAKLRRRIFPGLYSSLPSETRARISQRAASRTGGLLTGRALFFHCHPIVKRDQSTLARLNTFLNIYGFCRNVCMASLLCTLILLVGYYLDWKAGSTLRPAKLWWACAAAVCAVGMFYRYLKFFRQYTFEVFLTYAEID